MKKLTAIAVALSGLGSMVPYAANAATTMINPMTGGSGSFSWYDGLGAIDDIDGTGDNNNSHFSVTAGAGDKIDVQLNDCCIPGDQFALLLNGTVLTPTSFTTGTYTYTFTGVTLAAGMNIFDINVTALAPGFTDGSAFYAFSSVTGGGVPEPSAWALMILGFGTIGFAKRKAARRAAVSFA